MKRKAAIVGAGAIIALVSFSCLSEKRYRLQMQGKPAPDFSLMDLDGNKVQLSDFRGRPVVLTFWAYG